MTVELYIFKERLSDQEQLGWTPVTNYIYFGKERFCSRAAGMDTCDRGDELLLREFG